VTLPLPHLHPLVLLVMLKKMKELVLIIKKAGYTSGV
jgi:hypothetical protein